jgi:putative aldouronate transport system substrate-binding protein
VQPPQPVLAFTPDEFDIVKQVKTDVETVTEEWSAQFIRGVKPLSAWNDYVAELKKVGVDEWVKIYEAAYTRYKAKLK